MAILREHWRGPGIMHCFTGDAAQAGKRSTWASTWPSAAS